MGCPDEHELLDLIEGRLDQSPAADLERHLDECPRCTEIVASFGALLVEDSGPGDGAPLRPDDTVDRYSIVGLLGAGGMGQVYAARDPDLHRLVALKLVRDAGADPAQTRARQARLLREAQAMARLAHPNVVAVHDVGTFRDRVFLTMELVAGETLAAWNGRDDHDLAETLAVFTQAGRGLAAAHAAGLVHRDFKPSNVLLGEDGRVRVVDFGLAQPHSTGSAPTGDAGGPARLMTESGAMMGTPLYMAPEQHLGEPVDARTDQFAFCVALYESLYRRRPFAGLTPAELAVEVLGGRLREPPAGTPVPARLERVLARGLSISPDDRYPSMEALLADLSPAPPRRRRWITAAAAGAALASALTLLLDTRPTEVTCAGAEAFVAQAWGAPQREAARQAFQASGAPRAAATFDKVAGIIDRRAGALAATHTAACMATRSTGEQSDEVLGLRMACLERQRESLAALAELLSRADPDLVSRALEAAFKLPSPEACSGARVLSGRVAPPDPAAAPRVAAVQRDLARVKALSDAGKYREALDASRRAVDAARPIGYRPTEAEALYRLGLAEMAMHEAPAAERALSDAIFAANAAGLESRAADIALSLGFLTGIEMGKQDEGLRWHHQALGLIERVGGAEQRASAAALGGFLARQQGKYDEALDSFQRAAALYREAYGPDHPEVGMMETYAGTMLNEQGKLDEAARSHERSIAVLEKAYGPDHTDLTIPLINLSRVAAERGDHARSLSLLRRALALEEAAKGAGSYGTANICLNIGSTLARSGDVAGARPYFERALAAVEKRHGRRHPEALSALTNIATTYAMEGDLTRAAKGFEEVLSTTESLLGPDHFQLVTALGNLGQLEHMRGNLAAARKHYQRALSIREKAAGPKSASLVPSLGELGGIELDLGQRDAALEHLERAVAIADGAKLPRGDLAEVQFTLARALRAAHRDAPRAHRLAEEARASFQAEGMTQRAHDVDRFLAGRRAR